jgi:hypothetical protein
MKRLINPQPNGLVPFTNEDLLTLQNEGFDSLKQILNGYDTGFVLSGCGSVPGSAKYYTYGGIGLEHLGGIVDNTRLTIPAGYVWLDGDIRYFPGAVVPFGATFYIKADVITNTKKTMQDGTLKNVYAQTNATYSPTRPTTGQYITCNPTPDLVFNKVIVADIQSKLDLVSTLLTRSLADERDERTNADLQLNQLLVGLSTLVDTKVTKKITGTGWIDITLNSGFTTEPANIPGGFYKAQYKRTEDGFVHLRGKLDFNTNNTGSPAFTLPSGFTSSGEYRIKTSALVGFPVTDLGITVSISFGNVYISPNPTTTPQNLTIFLDNVRFFADGVGGVQ